jgi:1-phosphofructokinase/tagatose 6-phosphate kinase
MGAAEATITRPDGCVAAVGEGSERRLLEVHTEPLEPVSTVGSGDAFLAGYVAARYEGRSAEDCLAYGVACGAESTQHFGAGTVDRNQVERLVGEVAVHDLEVPAEV